MGYYTRAGPLSLKVANLTFCSSVYRSAWKISSICSTHCSALWSCSTSPWKVGGWNLRNLSKATSSSGGALCPVIVCKTSAILLKASPTTVLVVPSWPIGVDIEEQLPIVAPTGLSGLIGVGIEGWLTLGVVTSSTRALPLPATLLFGVIFQYHNFVSSHICNAYLDMANFTEKACIEYKRIHDTQNITPKDIKKIVNLLFHKF